MRILSKREYGGFLVRLISNRWTEIAYVVVGVRGLQLEVETPSDWHERKLGWVRIGLGIGKIAFAFPWWGKIPPDDGQCSGPTFGFNFFGDGLHLHWGKSHGKRDDPFTIWPMPWKWRHREHKILGEPESHPYIYKLKSGELQHRTATITKESRLWTRPWLPYRKLSNYIDVKFSDEVGERTGSWKGGCTGCGYDMLPGETPWQTLRRMESERKF